LRPLVYAPGSSRQVKLAYADILNYLSHQKAKGEDAVATARRPASPRRHGRARPLRLSAASVYAIPVIPSSTALALGQLDIAERLEQEVYAIAEKVLAQRRRPEVHADRALAVDS